MANKFNIISSSLMPVNETLSEELPVFIDAQAITPIPGNTARSVSSDPWAIGAPVVYVLNDDPLPDGDYSFIRSDIIYTMRIVDGFITSLGTPTNYSYPIYNSCEDYFNLSPLDNYYYNDISMTYYSNEFGLDVDKLNGTYNFYPNIITYIEGIQDSAERTCPYQYTLYENCSDAATVSNAGGTIYTTSQASGFIMGITEIYTDADLTTPYTSNIGYIYDGDPYYFETGPTGIVENYNPCETGNTLIAYNHFQDYFDNTNSIEIFIDMEEALTVGTMVYTDIWLSTLKTDDFIYNGLHYMINDGEIVDIEDYNIAPFSSGLYTSCSLTTPIVDTYYFRSDGMLQLGDRVYIVTDGLIPSSWGVLSYGDFVYNNWRYQTQSDGSVTNAYPCET